MSNDGTSQEQGTRISKQEAEQKFPKQFKTLENAQSLDNSEGAVCAWSKCIDNKKLIMKYDSAGNCTVYEYLAC